MMDRAAPHGDICHAVLQGPAKPPLDICQLTHDPNQAILVFGTGLAVSCTKPGTYESCVYEANVDSLIMRTHVSSPAIWLTCKLCACRCCGWTAG